MKNLLIIFNFQASLRQTPHLSHPSPEGLVPVVEVKDQGKSKDDWSHVLAGEHLTSDYNYQEKRTVCFTALMYLVFSPKCLSTVERTAEMYFGEQWLIMLVNHSATKACQPGNLVWGVYYALPWPTSAETCNCISLRHHFSNASVRSIFWANGHQACHWNN